MANGLKDARLLLFGQVDALGITATLNVEYSVESPAMLVITYQSSAAAGIRRKCRLAYRSRPDQGPRCSTQLQGGQTLAQHQSLAHGARGGSH